MKECPNCGTGVQPGWTVCPVCTMNLNEAANILGRDHYEAPMSGAPRPVEGFDYFRSGWVIVVGGIGLGYILVAAAHLAGLFHFSMGYFGFFLYLIVGSVIGKIGTIPFEKIKNETLRSVTSLLALVMAIIMVWSNLSMFG